MGIGGKLLTLSKRTFRVFHAGHSLFSKQDIASVPAWTSRVFHAGHLLCSTQDISCVPSRTSRMFHAGHQPLLLPSTLAPTINPCSYHQPLLLQNLSKIMGNRKTNLICFSKKEIRRQKIENYKSSETRFAEVSRRSEPCSHKSERKNENVSSTLRYTLIIFLTAR